MNSVRPGVVRVAVKVASGFYDNPLRGLPSGSGLMALFDASTGLPCGLLLDNGFLTELRTAAAGALAADLLARPSVERVGIVGVGVQARYQLEALLEVRKPRRVRVHGRTPERAHACAKELATRFGLDVQAVATAREAVEGAEVVVLDVKGEVDRLYTSYLSEVVRLSLAGFAGIVLLLLVFLRAPLRVLRVVAPPVRGI